MSERRKALGRGLSALLPTTEEGPQEVPTAAICASPNQPRRSFDDERLAELAESIRQHGVLQTLSPRFLSADGVLPMVAGERLAGSPVD